MAIIHSIKIARLTKKTVGDRDDVVVHANWLVQSYPEENVLLVTTTPGEINFNVSESDITSDFIDYNNLTEEDVAAWVEMNIPEIAEIKLKHEEKIQYEIDNPTKIQKRYDLPWVN